MISLKSRRLALWGGACALILHPTLGLAQDGRPATGPPVTSPRTNANQAKSVRPGGESAVAEAAKQVTPVPATASDPAPPGVPSVRVDVPGGAAAALPGQAAPAAGQVPTRQATRSMSNTKLAEGVVTRIKSPGKDLAEERIRFTLDPTQDWESYAVRGPQGLPDRSSQSSKATRKSKDRNADDEKASRDEDRDTAESKDKDNDQAVDLVLTHRAAIYTFARSPEGYELFGVDNPSAPDSKTSRSGNTTRPLPATAPGPKPASFANIREGSFVAVRYRKVNGVNEVLSLSIIELPTMTQNATAPGVRATSAAPAAPARVPTVPLTPTAPAVGRP